MEYNRIVSITGMPGLFEMLSSRADGAVVRSLENGAPRFASSRQHQFSQLETIEVYTLSDNLSLREIFQAMKESNEAVPESKADSKVLKAYFEKLGKELDFERVFISDLKKMVKWFQILVKNNIDFSAKAEETENAEKEA